ncbi:uncharacterized protein [Melopsittacus undulatus]|uniref:uncharacterized protein n=1 Tax=Melopsittacus undulatus TaxID=13146 RepID=UPI00146D5662|nr:uncharacterized protein LOC117437102 [Melopsittacus undulatus]
MRRCRAAALAGLAAVLLAGVSRAQIQQDPSVETTENIAISINCSHHNLPRTDFIHWYRQFPGRGPEFLVSAVQGSKQLQDPKGRLSVAADRRSNVLWLARPRLRDAAVYYCVQDHGEKNRGCGRAKTAAGGAGQGRAGRVCRGHWTVAAATARRRCCSARHRHWTRRGSFRAPAHAPAAAPESQSLGCCTAVFISCAGASGERRCSQAAEEQRFPSSSFAPPTEPFATALLSRGWLVAF